MKRVLFILTLAIAVTGMVFCAGSTEEEGKAVIGVIGPMTGAAAQSGENMKDAIHLAIDELSSQEAFSDIALETVIVDDEGNPTKSISGVKRLVHKEGAHVVLGAVHSSCTLANMEVTREAGIPQITPISTSPAITQQGNPYIFRTAATDAIQAENIVNIALDTLGNSRLAVIYVSNDYGRDAFKVLEKIAKEKGSPVVASETFNRGDKDFSSQLINIRKENPDTLIIWSLYEEAALIAKQVQQMGMEVQLMGGGGLTNSKYVELGGDATEGTIMCQTYHPSSSDSLVQAFTKNFKETYGRLPDPNAAQSYDAMMIVGAAIEKVGYSDSEALRDAIAATEGFKGVTGTITFDDTGDAPRDMMVIQIKNGEYTLYE